jgi:hypothetical protein
LRLIPSAQLAQNPMFKQHLSVRKTPFKHPSFAIHGKSTQIDPLLPF